jgi:hypothetical protein
LRDIKKDARMPVAGGQAEMDKNASAKEPPYRDPPPEPVRPPRG